MADNAGGTFFARLGGWLKSSRPTVTWIYCSAILFPMAFALVAALILRYRHAGPEQASLGFFTLFYLSLMVIFASVPRSIIPILIIWLAVARFKPEWDDHRGVRYGGLFLLMFLAVSAHALAFRNGFNVPWLFSGWLSVALPRMAFPILRKGLGSPA